MNDPRQTVQVLTHLHHPDQPSTEVITSKGQHFLVSSQGEVQMLVGEVYLPIEAVPQATIGQRFLLRYGPRAIVAGVGLAFFLAASFWLLFPVSSDVQEAYNGIVASLGWWTSQLLNLLAVLFVGRLFWMMTRSVSHPGEPGAAHTDFDAEPTGAQDAVCIIASSHPKDATLDERYTFALAQLANDRSPVVCVVLLRFRDPVGQLRVAGKQAVAFDRNKPVEIAAMPDEYRDRIFAGETWDQFVAYCDAYTVRVRDYAMRYLHKVASAMPAEQRDRAVSDILRKTATTVTLLCYFALGLVAQKSYQVETYLGTDRYEAMKPIGKVNFVFEQRVISRKGDGKFSFKQLLPNVAYYSDASDAGKLLRITVDNQPIQPIGAEPSATAPSKADKMLPNTPTQQPRIDPVRPKPLFDNQGQQEQSGHRFQIPDSATVAANLEAAKASVGREMGNITRSAHPVWNFLFWLFQSIQLLLICFIGLMRYYAKSAANEALITAKGRTVVGGWIVVAQQNAAAITLILVWIIAFFLLIDFFIGLMAMGLTPWLLIPIWFLTLKAAEVITDWLVPNLKVATKHGQPPH